MTDRTVMQASLWALALPLTVAAAGPAGAQAVPRLPSEVDISRERVPLDVPPRSDFELRIQTPEKSAVPRSVDELQFSIRAITVEGAAHYPAAEVDAFFTPLVGRTITLEELRDAAAHLEARYREDGFFLTRVFVPPQQVKDGTLIVRVVEGHVSTVTIDAPDAATRRRLDAVLQPLVGRTPVRLADVEGRLLTINDMPGINAMSVLRPGDALGGTDLMLTSRTRPNAYQFSINNAASRELGPWTYGANATINRPLGRIGALDAALSVAGDLRELWSGSLRYAEPISASGLTASIGALAGVARPGGRIRQLDVLSHVRSFSARLRYPLLRGRAMSLFLDAGLALNSSKTDALGQRIIADRQTVAEATLIWQQNGWGDGVTTASASVFQGIDAFGATARGSPLASVANFDPGFTRLSWLVQRSQRLPDRFSAYGVFQGQYTRDTLLSGEMVTFGGPGIGRAYDPSLIAGDRGIGGLIELRYDLATAFGPTLDHVQLYGFGDAARATSLANGALPKSVERLSSLGVGVRFDLLERLRVDAYLADARIAVPGMSQRDPRLVINIALNL
ncbi:MAG TPA: POTRA domain-containing protein [Sphingobium sp.]|nr:POTRA domain-containing protein [Sphingobium sp.]